MLLVVVFWARSLAVTESVLGPSVEVSSAPPSGTVPVHETSSPTASAQL
ncbi:hypothetical protein [Paraconexibacter algicola]|nr:hypothetical protein [Paraconexibacter algicola]